MALILIADDDEIIVEIVRETLTDAGHFVGAVDDGATVLSIVEAKCPDLVILDCNMPEVSGIEVLRAIRASNTCFDTPVLMLTGRHGATDKWVAKRSGANDYLCKPFELDELVCRCEALIEQAAATRRLQARHDLYPAAPPSHPSLSPEPGWGRR